MARMHTVKKSQKPQTCRVCGKEIPEGSPYKWTKPRYRGKIAAHMDCEIPLSMVSSSKMVAIWEQQTATSAAIADAEELGDIAEALRELASTVEEVADEYQESCDNQREYFPDSETAQDNEDKAEELRSWKDELEDAASEIDGMVVDDIDRAAAESELEQEEDETDEDFGGRVDEKLEEMQEEALNAALDEARDRASCADECPC